VDECCKAKIILAGGGTGGHLYPGIAIAQEFRRQRPEFHILFATTRRNIDQQILAEEDWPYVTLAVESFRGVSLRTVRAFGRLVRSVGQAMQLMRSYRPSLIIGLGAYPSVPVLVAGRLCGIPLLIQEQNVFPGGANGRLAGWADRICTSFPETGQFFPRSLGGRIVLTGNPVRHGFHEASADLGERFRKQFGLEDGKFTLLVFGGSSGAHRINEAVAEGLAHLPGEKVRRMQIIHQTGPEDLAGIKKCYEEAAMQAVVLPFIYQMTGAYQAADLVVCRAGATTVAEITALGKPSILISYAHAVGDHQTINARSLQQVGAAELITDQELTGGTLWSKIGELMDQPEKLSLMQSMSKNMGKPGAAGKIVRESLNLIEGRSCF